MSPAPDPLPDWDDVLSAASRLQGILPDAVLVGGTAVALYANHRRSYDADHVVPDLRSHFADVLQKTPRRAPLQILLFWQIACVDVTVAES